MYFMGRGLSHYITSACCNMIQSKHTKEQGKHSSLPLEPGFQMECLQGQLQEPVFGIASILGPMQQPLGTF